ncbi:NAD(P)/FAD-dependent oxidoreductase [Euzebya tangerina]|uniref:NAD(P)/FAD-dependent oxidoreductase n=1 Tax=Euzebya tangerina TaxID=591198 RepID=UPI000E31A204|nr:geranylgeranyl reductase family protein [Euzebya tangerina]
MASPINPAGYTSEPVDLSGPTETADVVVVGAGPGGAAAGYFLAQLGHDVVILEKESFPRDKVCGDGLTPRAVHAMRMLDLTAEAEGTPDGWARQTGLRMYGGGVVWNMPWPETDEFPTHSITATRALFDHTLAKNAAGAGAHLWEQTKAVAPIWSTPAEDTVCGVVYQRPDGSHGAIHARIVVLADGGSSRLAVQMGLHRDETRPMGTAVRAYYRTPRSTMDHMEGFLEMRNPDGELLPGYGWIFPLDDGLANVGWGLISTSEHYQSTSYRTVLDDWVASFPAEWEMNPETRVGRVKGAGLPMGHNRHPHIWKGAVLVGDSGGMVNPFNGEGISYAIEAADMAARAIDQAFVANNPDLLRRYPEELRHTWGGYYQLGRVFLTVMANPTVMRMCTEYGMPRRRLMDFVFRTMAHLVNEKNRNVTDVVINTLSRVVPAA